MNDEALAVRGLDAMRLLLVEDEADFAQALARRLSREGFAVDIVHDGEAALELADVHAYDLVLLDLNLPKIDGLDVCRALRAKRPELFIIMLTARDGLQDKIAGLEEGADDYIVKPFHFAELLARIHAVLRRDPRARTPVLTVGTLRLDPLRRLAWRGDERLSLTKKEFAILEYLMRRPGEVVTQEDLLEHVWDASANPFTASVRVHIHALRRKLGDSADAPRYIETVPGGYRLRTDESESRW
ncbi:MAG: DNA-binding response regulator [Hydrogenibacillus schlegelii]|uniref:DNA-binding response regulator n=1 Tax=Hydrogenibacillus schlegelii TaxID=1484 RepID=A0A2T5G3W5_HYDSH|nr:response regulator transcription factor [Hydrogenibacillus schlegelii]PTQ50852.1 MAG: DNA-binding response regulator [Hydrogenibacillus schlegelii]